MTEFLKLHKWKKNWGFTPLNIHFPLICMFYNNLQNHKNLRWFEKVLWLKSNENMLLDNFETLKGLWVDSLL